MHMPKKTISKSQGACDNCISNLTSPSFYYVDERKEDGSPIGDAIGGDAHADHFIQLARNADQGPWLSTLVKDKGYVKFS